MSATPSQLAALKWLRNRNADGVFDKFGVLVAAGECAPVRRRTWGRLSAYGYTEIYSKRRLRVTPAGMAVDLSKIQESQSHA